MCTRTVERVGRRLAGFGMRDRLGSAFNLEFPRIDMDPEITKGAGVHFSGCGAFLIAFGQLLRCPAVARVASRR